MDIQGAGLVAMAVLCGTASVLLAVAVIRVWDRRQPGQGRAARAGHALDGKVQPMVFLFRAARLVDATAPARALLDRMGAPDDDWLRLMRWIGPRFPDAPDRLSMLPRLGRIELVGQQGRGSATLRLVAEDLGDRLWRVSVTDPGAEHAGIVVDSMSLQAMEEELDLLRGALDQTPMLVWRLDEEDRVTWANAAYLRRAEARSDEALGWPLPRLLDAPRPVPGAGTATRRAGLEDQGAVSWYDCHSHRMGDEVMMFALPADAAVRAERSLRDFVQTLTKTFADLPIGLAIFDQGRNLQLFNPALIDLTNLPTGFLTARPSLFDFLDQLREQRMVPEPKDYRSWRQHMANLESAAANGHHVETWSLPGGQTYRVTGRPHPDGAVAFLFENITSEMSLTREFRAELLLGAHVLDGLEDGLVVFSDAGQLVLSNQAYRGLWGAPPESLADAIAIWEAAAPAGRGFAALRDALNHADAPRASGAMAGPQGQLLGWTVTILSGGRRMLRFGIASGQVMSQGLPQDTRPLSSAIGAD
ncbi:PAS-domain containing protein [Paracoccus sp. (in: a-proteobacteria)]|uniref:PAS-domain containing protein n=1 Tax=Paracoccus sp. TaxID=267 RepID=UPI00272AE516|nr:PAS-domain containing protein [Paracoccus sp. (in: a-proteobacteria)]